MDSISGSRTAVFAGSFGFDYMLQLCRDPENPPTYAALGFGISMLANRLSWFFNLKGPSIGLDSACSSTAMAIDMACKNLYDESCEMVYFQKLCLQPKDLTRNLGNGSGL
jgi:acyl transferase domain-containing protein